MGLGHSIVLIAAMATGSPVGPHHVGCNVTEMSGVHIHTKLTIVDHGKPVMIPANIGIVSMLDTVLCLYWLHTHDDTGLIHVEAPAGGYTLADFFAVWGEPLSRKRVGPMHGRVTATIDGVPYPGAPESIPLHDGQTIALQIR